MKTSETKTLNIKTNVKAGTGISYPTLKNNHNQAVKGLKVKTNMKAGAPTPAPKLPPPSIGAWVETVW